MKKLRGLDIRSIKHLRFCLGLTEEQFGRILATPGLYYGQWQIEKNGKIRDINEPREPLKTAQKRLNKLLQRVELPGYMYGGIRYRSNVANALEHISKKAILKADIKDFFPSIDYLRVQYVFEKQLGCSQEVAEAIASICTYRNSLPQGAPTSTTIANFAIEHLAYRLHCLALQHDASYTQFVDDITISGPAYLSDLEPLVAHIIEEEGFICHPKKLFTVRSHNEQIVTGVRVNEGKDAPTDKIKAVRASIHELEELAQRGQMPGARAIRSLKGKINYISQLNKGTGKFLRRKLKPLKAMTIVVTAIKQDNSTSAIPKNRSLSTELR